MSPARRRLRILRLGRVPYTEAHRLQRVLAERRHGGQVSDDLLLLLEHEPTITLGRGTRASSLPEPAVVLASEGFTVTEVERGGDVTWHGPGQLVGYPILDLTGHRPDLHWYLRQVEGALIEALDTFGIAGTRRAGYTGVWTEDRKIASIGIHVRHWVTTHGFALNVVNDLAAFGRIVPCGIQDVEMTSVERELVRAGRPVAPGRLEGRVADAVAGAVARTFGLDPMESELARLLPEGTALPAEA